MALGLSDSTVGAGQSWNPGSAMGEEVQDGVGGDPWGRTGLMVNKAICTQELKRK